MTARRLDLSLGPLREGPRRSANTLHVFITRAGEQGWARQPIPEKTRPNWFPPHVGLALATCNFVILRPTQPLLVDQCV